MKQIKRFILRVIFTTEIIVFCFFYVFGANGLSMLWRLEKENEHVKSCIRQEEGALQRLRGEIIAWQESSFYKEKIAREKLQMIKNGEVVYFDPTQ